MFEQAAIAVQDNARYDRIHAGIDQAFLASGIERFLDRVSRAGLRIRDFEGVLGRGLIGKDLAAEYTVLPVSDQALTRERYLALVEQVDLKLRQRYMKIYAYY